MKTMTDHERENLINIIAYRLKAKDFRGARDVYRCIVEDYGKVRIADEIYGAARKQAKAA